MQAAGVANYSGNIYPVFTARGLLPSLISISSGGYEDLIVTLLTHVSGQQQQQRSVADPMCCWNSSNVSITNTGTLRRRKYSLYNVGNSVGT